MGAACSRQDGKSPRRELCSGAAKLGDLTAPDFWVAELVHKIVADHSRSKRRGGVTAAPRIHTRYEGDVDFGHVRSAM
jgi:hypothetical protein